VTAIVLDASITLSWCFPDEQTPTSLAVLDFLELKRYIPWSGRRDKRPQ